jgi:hypothetical protein
LAKESGVPLGNIIELLKLSDLARIPGLKKVRARLYYEAGLDTLEKITGWDPEEMRQMFNEFIKQTGLDGIASLPKEAASTVATAKHLPKIVEY